MQRLQLTLFLCKILFLRSILAIDFCDIKSCHGKRHIGCDNNMVSKVHSL